LHGIASPDGLIIQRTLDETGGKVTRAATMLGISRKGLQNKMKEFGCVSPTTKLDSSRAGV
jgi:DNA-binding NtrC family response regulator